MGETQSPLALGRRFRRLVLSEFHLDMRQSPAQCMEWNAVVHRWIQIVWLIISDNHVAGPTQRSEYRVGKAAVEMAGKSDFPGSWFAGKRSRHGMNGNRDSIARLWPRVLPRPIRPRRDRDGTSVRCGSLWLPR